MYRLVLLVFIAQAWSQTDIDSRNDVPVPPCVRILRLPDLSSIDDIVTRTKYVEPPKVKEDFSSDANSAMTLMEFFKNRNITQKNRTAPNPDRRKRSCFNCRQTSPAQPEVDIPAEVFDANHTYAQAFKVMHEDEQEMEELVSDEEYDKILYKRNNPTKNKLPIV